MGYSVALAVIAIAPIFTGLAGNLYAAFAVVLNIGYLALAYKVWTSRAGEIADSADEFWRLKGCCAEFKGVHSASLSHTSLVTAFEREMLMVRDIPPYCLSYTYGVLMRI